MMKKNSPKETWTLPALVDRRKKPRPARESAQQRARAAAKRRRSI